MFSIIAAVGKNNELGKNNNLLFHIKEDLKFFQETTLRHKVVMGHKTWDSLPNKLKNRENIVLSRHKFEGPDVIIHDIDQFIAQFKDTPEEIFIVGGGTVYYQFLPHVKTIYLTEVDASSPGATTFFPEFDKTKFQKQIIKKGSDNGLNYVISKYNKIEEEK